MPVYGKKWRRDSSVDGVNLFYSIAPQEKIFALKGPLPIIGLFQKWPFHPYITLKKLFLKFKIQKKILKNKLKILARLCALLRLRNDCGWIEN